MNFYLLLDELQISLSMSSTLDTSVVVALRNTSWNIKKFPFCPQHAFVFCMALKIEYYFTIYSINLSVSISNILCSPCGTNWIIKYNYARRYIHWKTELGRSHWKDAKYENGKGNLLLETHIKKANRKTKDTLGDDVRKDIQKIKVPNWKTFSQDRRRWKELVEKAKTL